MANPKSAILILLLVSRMLAGLRSLWMILLEYISEYPEIICFRMSMASVSGSVLLEEMNLERSPPSQYSVIM